MPEHPGSFDNPFGTNDAFGTFTGDDPFGAVDFFEETNPQALFSARVNQLTPASGQRNRLNSLFSQIFQQYEGFLAQQALGGQLPTARFGSDFLEGLTPGFGGFNQFVANLGPEARGTSTQQFRPPTTFRR